MIDSKTGKQLRHNTRESYTFDRDKGFPQNPRSTQKSTNVQILPREECLCHLFVSLSSVEASLYGKEAGERKKPRFFSHPMVHRALTSLPLLLQYLAGASTEMRERWKLIATYPLMAKQKLSSSTTHCSRVKAGYTLRTLSKLTCATSSIICNLNFHLHLISYLEENTFKFENRNSKSVRSHTTCRCEKVYIS